MNLIVCLDDRGGMAFNHRRQSRDKKQRMHMLKMLAGKSLLISSYTAKLMEAEVRQFPDIELTVSDNCLEEAGENDYVFTEREDVSACMERVDQLLVYRWNRLYPSDVCFPRNAWADFHKISETSIVGNSHDRIDFEVYVR